MKQRPHIHAMPHHTSGVPDRLRATCCSYMRTFMFLVSHAYSMWSEKTDVCHLTRLRIVDREVFS